MAEENRDPEVRLTPSQINEIIEEKLTHLKPVLEGALSNLRSLHTSLKVKDCNWKDMWENARTSVG